MGMHFTQVAPTGSVDALWPIILRTPWNFAIGFPRNGHAGNICSDCVGLPAFVVRIVRNKKCGVI